MSPPASTASRNANTVGRRCCRLIVAIRGAMPSMMGFSAI